MILSHMHFYADVDFLLCNGFRCFLKVKELLPGAEDRMNCPLCPGCPLLDIFLRAIDFERQDG